MKITGYQLMDRLEELKEQAKTFDGQFKGSLFRFEEDEKKANPRDLMTSYEDVERKITLIQEAQAEYNLGVKVTVLGESMSLHRAVRLGSVAGRLKNQWKTAVGEGQPAYYGYQTQMARDKEHEYARRVVEADECLRLSDEASKRAAAFKRAIRAGNATEADLDLDPNVFE